MRSAAIKLKDTYSLEEKDLDSVIKSRDTTLMTNVHIVKAMLFPVVMCGCESWAIKKRECQRIDAFKLWCWREFLRVPWAARRSNLSILKEINPEYSLERLMTKMKRHYFGHWYKEPTHWKRAWNWERLRAGGEGGDRDWDGWMVAQTQWTWVWANSGRQWSIREACNSWSHKELDGLSDWTITTTKLNNFVELSRYCIIFFLTN